MRVENANVRGSLFMIGSMAGFNVNDAFMKGAGFELPLSQAIVLRGIPTTILIFALAYALGALRFTFTRNDWRILAIRNVTEIATAYLFIKALFNMEFANAIAILQALPLTITLAGAIFLGEPVGWRRWTAIIIGLCGVLMIVQPGLEGFTIYSLYILGVVICVTIRDIVSRQLSEAVPSATVALFNAVSITVVFAVYALFEPWVPVSMTATLNLSGASLFIIGAYFCAVSAVRAGDLAVVAPFRYTALLWAMFLGVAVFGERLDALTLVGASIVVATGIYSFNRERVLAKARQAR